MVVDTVPSSLVPSGNDGAVAFSASSQQNNMSGTPKQTFNGHHDIYAKAAGKSALVLFYH